MKIYTLILLTLISILGTSFTLIENDLVYDVTLLYNARDCVSCTSLADEMIQKKVIGKYKRLRFITFSGRAVLKNLYQEQFSLTSTDTIILSDSLLNIETQKHFKIEGATIPLWHSCLIYHLPQKDSIISLYK